MRFSALFLVLSLSCDLMPQPPQDAPPEAPTPAPTFTAEEQAVRAVAERFVKALRDKDATTLGQLCTPSLAFQDFLSPPPQSAPQKPPKEEDIAKAAIASQDAHLRKLSESKLGSLVLASGTERIVVLEDAQTTLLALTISGEKVVRIGAVLDKSERWRQDRCARLSAPILVPRELPEDAVACREQIKTWKTSIAQQGAASLSEMLLSQPLLTAMQDKSLQEGLSRFGQGQDSAAFAFGQEQGQRALSAVWAGLVSYCSCLPRKE